MSGYGSRVLNVTFLDGETTLRRCMLFDAPAVGELIRLAEGDVQWTVVERRWFVGDNRVDSDGKIFSPLFCYIYLRAPAPEPA